MIRRLIYKILVLVACSALFAGCEQGFLGEWFDGPSGVGSGDASLTITIEAPADDNTRAVAADGTAAAGDKMNKLLALLVGNDGKIVARQEVVDTASGFTDATNKKAVITFDNLAGATYSVYLIANYESVTTVNWANYTVGVSVGTALTDALVGATLTGTATPSFETYGMPMTAELTTTLQHGTNAVSAEVERVVGRFGVSVHNHVVGNDYKVVVSNIDLSSFNASNTYLFNHSNALPTSAKPYRKFFETATESTYVPVNKSTPFDQYVYETDESATYALNLAVAIFNSSEVDAITPPSVVTTKEPEAANHSEVSNAGVEYFLYNRGQTGYFYMTDTGDLMLSDNVPESTEALYDNYKWVFSGTSSGTIYNVGAERYLRNNGGTLTTTTSSYQATTFTFGENNSSFFMRYGSSGQRPFISGTSETEVGFTTRNNDNPNQDYQRWYLRLETTTSAWQPAEPVATAVISNHALTYDDEGYVKPLEQIKRNQNIQVGVNLFYNPKEGYFNFEVETWVDKTIDNVTFD